jgi:hypothetical protein
MQYESLGSRWDRLPRIRYLGAKKLASAVLLQALDDWRNPEFHDEVESFLQEEAVSLYAQVVGISKHAYVKSVRRQHVEKNKG